jgi:transposase
VSAPTRAPEIDPEVVALVDRAKDGDAQAFADLYDRYVDQTFAYVYRRVGHRQLAEDLVGRRLPARLPAACRASSGRGSTSAPGS